MEAGPKSNDGNALKRVFIIAYYWPPAGGPGVQRWLKFSKYLPENGWQPTLLVPDGAAYPVLDATLADDIPEGIEVIKVPIFEPYDLAIRLFQGKKKPERLGSLSSTTRRSLSQTIMLWARGNLLIPDPRILWRRRARKAGQKVWKQAQEEGRPFQALVTTGPPHSVHLIGLDLKQKFGMPWLADFRDLWREMDYLEDFLPTKRTKRRHATMEQTVVQHADKITVPTPGVGHSLRNQNDAVRHKFALIHNGWDPGDIQTNDAPSREDEAKKTGTAFHLGHFGSLFPTRDIPGLWTAIRRWNTQVPADRMPIHLDLVGNINPSVRASLTSSLIDSDWTDHGYMPHGDAIEKMMEMDALLLVQNNNQTGQWAIPGKAFEYLATGIPIEVVSPMPSDLGDLSKEWGFSPTHHEDVEGCSNMLNNLFEPYESKPEVAMTFSRRTLTTKMAGCLNEISDKLD